METFVRNLDGFLLLDKTPIDSSISNYQADGFISEPRIVGWASYGRMKSILHRVLGRQVFDTLFRENGFVRSDVFGLAATIVMHYVQRPVREMDLQTTLIANLIATRCNLSSPQRAKAIAFSDRLTEECQFERYYAKHVKNVMVEKSVMTVPWWVTITY